MATQPPPGPAGVLEQRNSLALVSFYCGLYTLVSVVLSAITYALAFPHAGHPLSRSAQALLTLVGPLGALFFPATVIALVTGILAVRRARTLLPHRALRARAWTGLLLGAFGSLWVLLAIATLVAFIVASAVHNA
jgi:hypothetical protein